MDYEWDMSVKLEKTSEFANCWINGTVEQDENVNEIRLLNLWHCLICGTVEWD